MPTDLASFLLLLLFIAPGFLFERAYWRDLPRYYRDPDLFQQTVFAIIASSAIHFLLIILMMFAWFEFRMWIIDLLSQPLSTSSIIKLPPNLVILTVYPILSLGIGWFGGFLWRRRSPPPHLPLWANLVAEAQSRQKMIRLRIRLRNGEQYVGTLKQFFWIGSKETTYELALTAVSCENPDKPRSKPVRMLAQTLLFLSSDILWLSQIEPSIGE